MSQTVIERPAAAAYVSAYVPAQLREELERLAERNFRTLSGELRLAMTRHVAASRQDTPEAVSGSEAS
jgi:hypothetical protein